MSGSVSLCARRRCCSLWVHEDAARRGASGASEAIVFIGDVRAGQIVADADHVWWTEARIRERDDRDIAIAAAAVRRRAHRGGAIEAVFDFRCDDLFCVPHDPVVIDAGIGWLCSDAVLDSSQRADPAAYCTFRDGALQVVPAPGLWPGQTTTDGQDVYALRAGRPGEEAIWCLDLSTGSRRRLVEIPASLGRSRRMIGLAGGRLLGEGAEGVIWSAELGGLPPEAIWRRPEGSALHAVAADGARAVVSWGAHPRHRICVVDGVGTHTLWSGPLPAAGLQLSGARLCFAVGRAIHELHLATGRTRVVVGDLPERPRRLAVGGGHVYWIQHGGIQRHPL